jgi:cell division protein FtsW
MVKYSLSYVTFSFKQSLGKGALVPGMRDDMQEEQKVQLGQPDFIILITTVIIVGFGIVMVYSASHHVAYEELGDSAYFLKRQLIWALLGFILLYITMHIPHTFYQKLVPLILFVLLIMMILVLIPGIGVEQFGARSWIDLKVMTLQPSEFVKLGLIIYLASIFAKKQEYISDFKRGVLPPLIIVGLFCGLTLVQRDLGTTTMLMMFTLILMFSAGIRLRHMFFLGLTGAALFTLFAVTQPYRLRRLTSFRDPWSDPSDTGYQLIQSLYAFGNGGLWGAGFDNSIQKQFYLPFAHTDFIFAVIGEEWGFIGSSVVIVLYAILVLRGIQISLRSPHPFSMLLGVGLSSMIGLQAMINMGVATGLLPVTGLTLPLISYGGSSLLLSLISIGILLNISRYTAVKTGRENQEDEFKPRAL